MQQVEQLLVSGMDKFSITAKLKAKCCYLLKENELQGDLLSAQRWGALHLAQFSAGLCECVLNKHFHHSALMIHHSHMIH